MKYIGLLTHQQKQAGYFVAQDEDFIYVFHSRNTDQPRLIGVWLYDTATIREIREAAERDRDNNVGQSPQANPRGQEDYDPADLGIRVHK